MKINKKILAFAAAVAILAFLWFVMKPNPAKAVTDRGDYKLGDTLEVSLKNDLDKPVCFSGCYPYYIEKSNGFGKWEQYPYDSCQESDVVSGCIGAKSEKKFRLSLDEVDTGKNRLKIPVCIDCLPDQEFKPGMVVYSNNFEIK